MYRVFDGNVACDFPLTGVPTTQHSTADIEVVLGSGFVDESDFDWFHSWRGSDGELLLSCARQSDTEKPLRHLVRFPTLADFVISGSTVLCYPGPDCRADSLRHLVLDQVIPRVWAHRGHLVLHASAVQLANGRVIAFLGESGWGKSTLAGAMQMRGGRLLSDDCLSLRADGEGVQLIPSYTGLRLNEDSIDTLGMKEQCWTSVSHYSDKQQRIFDLGETNEPLWLDALYIMSEPSGANTVFIGPLAGADLVATLIRRSFVLDINDTNCAARQMYKAAAVGRVTPKVYSLDYPREYKQLSALCEILSETPPL